MYRADLPEEASTPATTLLYASPTTRVLRFGAVSVAWKEPLGPRAADRLRHEGSTLQRLAGVEGVVQLASQEHPASVLAVQPCGTATLADALAARRLPLAETLALGEALARILARVHAAGIIHAQVQPSNIVLMAEGRPLLIDFDRALPARGAHDGAEMPEPSPYIAPEQTGRTGRIVDERADLYAVGCMLYEMATGRRPFESVDALELIHDHLARNPAHPSAVDAAVPEDLSRIILRLLAKDPEQRYQSAEGLAHDLARLRGAAAAAPFTLGDRDFAPRLQAPAHPVGREREIAALVEAFRSGLNGGARGVLLAGGAGSGKTMLANQLRSEVAARGGWFVSGKFESQRQDLASDGMFQCLRALGRLILALPEAELARLRSRIADRLGPAGASLVATVPEFELLLGVPQDPAALRGPNAKERLVAASVEILRGIAAPDRPVVLLLDDLQWAPPLPLAGVHAVLSDPSVRDVFLVCAYRDGDLQSAPPLATLLPRWERLSPAPQRIAVRHLDASATAALLAHMLRLAPEPAAELAVTILAHADGNPFDTVELVDAMRREGALVLREGGWTWDAAAIARHVAQASVGKLLAARVAAQPAPTRDLLDVLACLGGTAGMPLLQAATGLAGELLLQRLEPALRDGLLQPPGTERPDVRFSHDRVHQATLERLAAGEREQLQLSLARKLASDQPAAAAAQYLAAVAAITDQPERLRAARLLHATAASLRAFNTVAADRLLAGAIALLTAAGADAAAVLPLRIERHALLFALGRLDEAGELYASIERDCEDPLQLAPATAVQVCSLTNLGRAREALALGRAVLARLGAALQDAQQLQARMSQGGAVVFDRWLAPAAVAADLQRADASDPRALAAGRLLDRMMPAGFFCDPDTFATLVLAGIQLWSEHGPAREFMGAVSHMPFVSIAAWQDYRAARSVMQSLLRIGEARGWEPETSQARFLYALCASPWWEGLEHAVSEAQRAHHGLLDGGDLQNACFTFYASLYALLDCGTLQRHAGETQAALVLSTRTGNDFTAAAYLPHRQLGRSLRGETVRLGSFDDAEFAEEAHAQSVRGSFVPAINYHVVRGIAALVAGDMAAVAAHGREALPYARSGPIYLSADARLLHALGVAFEARTLAPGERAVRLAEADASCAWLAARAADAPAHFQHLVDWLEAERAWAAGDLHRALVAFDRARVAADAASRPWQRAAIMERCALLLLEHGVRYAGEHGMARARAAYQAWGASAKVRALEARHPFLRPRTAAGPAEGQQGRRDERIDMLALLRASQALSSNTSLAGLKATLVDLVQSLTGATGVQLALWDAGSRQWQLSASSADASAPMPVEAAAGLGLLPLSAFQYAARTLQPLVVDDASRDDRFARDPYLAGQERCSLLVFPILSQGEPTAMLILENRLARGAFSAARLDAVRLIAGQLAVSLQNALMYEQLERRVEERTRELRAAQAELVATARKAGKAEIASNVLHNVGNVLNSVNVSATLVMGKLRASKVEALERAVGLMHAHSHDLGAFLTTDEKGRRLPEFLARVAEALGGERREIMDEVANLKRSVGHINNAIAMQQSHAGGGSLFETVDIRDLFEEALRINGEALARVGVRVERDLADVPAAELDRTRVTDILVNLVRNAVQAMEHVPDPRLGLQVGLADGMLRVRVADAGVGIRPENLTRIFSHGFTTRADGHGFGLHSCALAARNMGGALTAESEGEGRGAAFVLQLPLRRPAA